MDFKRLYNIVITEAKFRDSKHITHIVDVPMFSIFVANKIINEPDATFNKEVFDQMIPELKRVFGEARKQITKIGFNSMHVNVVINNIKEDYNRNTGETGVGGYAHYSRKYMSIDLSSLLAFSDYTIQIIVHEWAHLWMINNSKQFKHAVKYYYEKTLKSTLSDPTIQQAEIHKISYPTENSILNIWSSAFDHRGMFYTLNKYIAKSIPKNKNLSWKEMLILFPFQHIIHNLTNKKTFTGKKIMRSDDIFIQSGEKIHLFKYGDSLFRMGTYVDGSLIETDVTLKDIPEYFDTEELKEKITTATTSYMEIPESKKLIEDFARQLQNAFASAQRLVSREDITSEEKDMINNWVKTIIWPTFKQLCRAPKKLASIISEDKLYYELWVNNKKKPPNLSVVNLIQAKHAHHKTRHLQSLEGKDLEPLKKLVSYVSRWPSTYGMSNNHEFWATAIEYFFSLNPKHRSKIIQLINQNK